ncbi:hypothetical protein [Neptuniibacter sp. QD37_11]|uniref:hypothetical protein n=1 Tax=Neptuniibacter sp. QD37_11 TaxID=3398209 RepID=UPI0039F46F86
MKIAFGYLAIPVLFGFCVAIYSSLVRGFSIEENWVQYFYGVLFYLAPFAMFSIFHLLLHPHISVVHAGYIGSVLALFLIAAFWLLPPDPSGLPIQWMAYWPLAGILMVLFSGGTYVFWKYRNS